MYQLSPEAQAIDEAFVKQNSTWSQFYNQAGNKYGYKLVTEGVNALREKVSTYKPQSRFEELWRDNILHELEIQEMLAHHYHGRPRITVPELVDKACGPGTYNLFEEAFTNYDHEGQWKLREEAQEHGHDRVPNNTDEAKKAIQAYIPVLKDELYKHGTEAGFIPDGFVISVDLGTGRAFWNTDLKRFFLGQDKFDCELREGEIKVVPIGAYETAFHEVFGHGSQQINSGNLPQSMQMTTKNVLNVPSRVAYEGLAVQRGFLSYDWMRANAGRLDMNTEEINISERDTNSFISYPNVGVSLCILQERRKWEDLDIESYLSKLEANPRVVWRFSDPINSGFTNAQLPQISSAIFELCYPVGHKLVKGIASQFQDADRRRLNTALATGVWSWKVYPEAVEYFLSQSEQK